MTHSKPNGKHRNARVRFRPRYTSSCLELSPLLDWYPETSQRFSPLRPVYPVGIFRGFESTRILHPCRGCFYLPHENLLDIRIASRLRAGHNRHWL